MCTDAAVVTVLCVDDNWLLHQALERWFERFSTLKLIGSTDSPDEALQAAETFHPGVVLVDVDLPGADAFALVSQLVHKYPFLHVAMLSAHCSAKYIAAAVNAGATGYICKDETPETIAQSIQAISRGEFTLSPSADEAYKNDCSIT